MRSAFERMDLKVFGLRTAPSLRELSAKLTEGVGDVQWHSSGKACSKARRRS